MKVCVVGLRGMPGVMGGIEKHCEQIYPRIAALNEDVQIVVTGRSPYLPVKESRYQRVLIHALWTLKNKYLETMLHTFIAVLYARFVVQADIIHIHAIGPALYAPLARLLGMKVVVTHHGADYQRQKWSPFAKWLLRRGEQLAVVFSHKLIVVGASLAELLRKRYPEHADKIYYIPNGADVIPKQINESLAQHPVLGQFGLEPRKYILAVGRLVPEKGFQDLIAAYQRSQLDIPLVITGAADHPDEFSRRLLANAGEKIIFTGFQSGDALKAIYSQAAVFVLPSYHEGLPIVVLEALSYELPVVLSDIPPNLDVQLPEACYFKTGDTAALAEKLSVGDFNRYRADTRLILDCYDWDEIANQTLSLYQSRAAALAS